MGTGKTEVGKALARMLGLDFVDTDSIIEGRAGTTIAGLFDSKGEAHFRELEEQVCAELKGRQGAVIATGGGMLMNEKNLEALSQTGTLVLVEASVETLCERLRGESDRPMLRDAQSLRERIDMLLAERAPVYHRIETRIDTSTIEPEDAAALIASGLDIPFQSFPVHLVPAAKGMPRGRFGPADVEIGRGVLSRLGERLRAVGLESRAFLLMPQNLQDLYLSQVRAALDAVSVPFSVVTIKDGDEHKTIEQATVIIDELLALGARRDAVIVPIGGGVTGDIGGFVAALLMRGVPLVQVPTTLLAQVDASIGAKVGVNHPLAKNLMGSFYQPHVILSDPCTLRTLELEDVSNGMGEVVKSAIIGSEALFEFLEEHTDTDASETLRRTDFLEHCVVECARIKTGIVNRDPFEQGERMAMNLGHTLGHALEAVGGYRGLKHGQAISLGMIVALRIAVDRGLIPADLLARTRRLLEWCRLPVEFEDIDRGSLAPSLRLDKKIKKGKLHFVLPKRLGAIEVVSDVTEDEIFAAMEER